MQRAAEKSAFLLQKKLDHIPAGNGNPSVQSTENCEVQAQQAREIAQHAEMQAQHARETSQLHVRLSQHQDAQVKLVNALETLLGDAERSGMALQRAQQRAAEAEAANAAVQVKRDCERAAAVEKFQQLTLAVAAAGEARQRQPAKTNR